MKRLKNSQKVAFQAVNRTLVLRNWLLGKRISEEEVDGAGRAEYSSKVISTLADCLTERYGKGFTKRSLYKYQQFYKCFPEIMPSVGALSADIQNVPSVSAQLLSWTHYRALLTVP